MRTAKSFFVARQDSQKKSALNRDVRAAIDDMELAQ
jgi:hypothetical protein